MIHNDLITPPLFEGESARQERSSQASRWGDIKRQNNLKFSRELRQNVTDVERILWYHLRNTQLGGYKFRRQPIGKYIVDFVCMSNKIIVELNGSQHAEQQAVDLKRDTFLRERGYLILCYWNNQVFDDGYAVLKIIITTYPHRFNRRLRLGFCDSPSKSGE